MNLPKLLTSKNYKKHSTVLRNHAKLMANQSMKDAVKELHSKSNATDNDLINCNYILGWDLAEEKGAFFIKWLCYYHFSGHRESIGC